MATGGTRGIRLARMFLGALLLQACAAWAALPQLIVPYAGPKKFVQELPFESEATAVRFNAKEMLALRYRDEVEVRLPNATSHSFVFELAQSHGNGIHSWIGHHKQHGTLHRAVITTGPGGSYGVISTPEGEYRLVPGDGYDWLVDMTAEQQYLPVVDLGNDAVVAPPPSKKALDDFHAPETFVAIPGLNTVGMAKVTPAPQAVVDILFVYTQGLATHLGSNLLTRLNFLVTRANTAYADSEVAITLRLVGAVMVNYPDSGSDSVALSAITPDCTVSTPWCGGTAFNAATFGNLETLRNTYGADVVALMRDGSNNGGSGIAWVGSSPPNSRYMYSVTTGCVAGCESVFIHELGHNMGNQHDRSTAAYQNNGTPGQGAYPYSFGYAYCTSGALSCNPAVPGSCTSQPECSTADTGNFSDLMSYFHGTTLRNYKFSNPGVTCAGPNGFPRACGIAEAAPNSANTALSMNNNRLAVSALKATVVGGGLPGALQFTAAGFSAAESAGTLSLTVSRVGGGSGAVQVAYATADGSALAGSDYTAVSGTLSWADGDTANKTISVPITNDALAEGNEAFSVTLSNPTGAAGVSLGNPVTATAMILEPWPPGGTLPAGFSTPSGSGGAWAPATDFTYEGTTSLRSAQVYATYPTYSSSDLQFTGNFTAGTVGFAYRVSSWANDGYVPYSAFQFSIDGVVVLSDTGESGWRLFASPISAGVHTLQWTFRNSLAAPCSLVGPPPAPGGSACADRAWIDALLLPLVAPANFGLSPTALAFGGQSMQTSSPAQAVTVTNTTAGTLTISAVSVSNPQFTQSNNCATLAVGASCTVNVTFTPAVAGGAIGSITPVTGTLTVTTVQQGAGVVAIAGTAEKSLVTHYYRSALRRAPDAGGKTYWEGEAARVFGLGANVNEAWYALAMSFYNSAEYTAFGRNDAGYLTDLYSTFFNRAPDTAGFDYWSGLLASGLPREGALASFMFSTEFANFTQGVFGNTAARAEVDAVVDFYRGLLARLPDSAGYNFWLQRFRAAQCQGASAVRAEAETISNGFANGAEYTARNRSTAQYVSDLYNAFLRRGPDLAGAQYWINQINTGARSRDAVRREFTASPEFTNRVNAIIAQGCI